MDHLWATKPNGAESEFDFPSVVQLYLFRSSDSVGAREGHDAFVVEAHAIEHVADVVLRACSERASETTVVLSERIETIGSQRENDTVIVLSVGNEKKKRDRL